jgi:outer membrane lipoprotein-sorting protein
MEMNRTLAVWIGVSVLWGGYLAATESPGPQKILESADQYRAGWGSFMLVTRITNFKGDKLEEESQYEVYSQRARCFVKFLNPRDKGRSLLMLEDDMWIYMPSTSRPIRITPMQRLTGNVSNGDVARTNYSEDYDATLLREEAIEGKLCYVLELKAKRKGATYPMIQYWVSKNDYAPCKAEFFLTSGKNHKTAIYETFSDFQGKRLLTRMTIYDKIRKDDRSVMEFLRYAPRNIPDKYFNKNSMSTN